MLHRTVREGLGPAYLAGFQHALDQRRRLRVRDGLRLLPRPRRPRAPAGGRARRGRRPRAGLALRARRRGARLGARAPDHQPRRLAVRGDHPRPARARPDRRLQVLPRRGAARDRPAERPGPRLRVPGRADQPHDPPRLPRGRSADHLPRPPARHVEDEHARSPWRRWCSCRACGAATAEAAGRAFKRAARPADLRGRWPPSSSSSKACATRVARWSAGTRARGRRWARGWGSPLAICVALLAAVLRRRPSLHARSRAECSCRASTSRRRSTAVGHILVSQLARARAARDGLRRGLHRRQLAAAGGRALLRRLALGPRQGRPAGDRLRHRGDDASRSSPRPTRSGSAASTLAAHGQHVARACCSSASSRTRSPS